MTDLRWHNNAFEYLPWIKAGVQHGFSGVSKAVYPSELLQLDQCHSAEIVVISSLDEWQQRLNSPPARADGVIVRRGLSVMVGAGIAVRTADCLPVLACGSSHVAAIHAGWRGLGAGILQRAARLLSEHGERAITWLIGPAAGPLRYEVGAEVISNFCFEPVTRTDTQGKLFLDLPESARRAIIMAGQDVARIVTIPIDTLEDLRFFSYRRCGSGCGRNLSWLCIS